MTEPSIRRTDSGEVSSRAPSIPSVLSGHSRTILIAEDDRVLRTSLEIGLSYRGFRVLAAPDGSEAFQLFRRYSPEIALVLSDVNMPVLDGPQLLNALRAMTSSLRFCFMTGDGRPRNLTRLRSLGAVAAFAKPFPSVAELADELWRLCSLPPNSENPPGTDESPEPGAARFLTDAPPPIRPSIVRRWNAFLRKAIAGSLPTLPCEMTSMRVSK